ncbi:c-type cytochrome biogenesis protein CcmI [Algihabitans albus]|uniref:c-type cytochrome biogenesis protein CcmI n=1 Tax=Algihabitans albus TaxID=2164067 RepID=UPI000E5D270C|nr:c-type cytochrome biogenesis protein CcmI [Algihabitans albus]
MTGWIFWTAAAALSASVVALLLRPLLRRPQRQASSAAYDLQVYKDQLAEVASELERGNLTPSEAHAAQAEIERRLLKAAEAEQRQDRAGAGQPAKVLAMVLTALLPLGTLGLYLYSLGSPGVPSMPFAERAAERQQSNERERLIAELADRMREDPSDPRGWEILARNYAAIGRYLQAAEAYGEAIARGFDRSDLRANRAETLIAASDGMVTPEARREIEAALRQNPNEPLAIYYVGVMHEQAAQPRQAVETWARLLRELPPDIAGRGQVMARLTEVARSAGLEPADFDTASRLPPVGAPPLGALPPGSAPPGQAGNQSGSQPGPTREQMDAAQEMSPEERQAMVQGMVEGLASRLEETPDDLDGWLRLARAYAVLGQRDEAVDALERAQPLIENLASDDPRRQAVEQGLQSLRNGS